MTVRRGDSLPDALPGGALLRPVRASDAVALTALLHRAYAVWGERGLNFTALDQSVATTRARLRGGASWVVDLDGVLLATATLSTPPSSALRRLSPAARVPGRSWLNQLAVEPEWQGRGLARALWRQALVEAVSRRIESIGVDTAAPADSLLALYRHWGFAPVEEIRWPGKTYRSAVLVQPVLAAPTPRPAPSIRPVGPVGPVAS